MRYWHTSFGDGAWRLQLGQECIVMRLGKLAGGSTRIFPDPDVSRYRDRICLSLNQVLIGAST